MPIAKKSAKTAESVAPDRSRSDPKRSHDDQQHVGQTAVALARQTNFAQANSLKVHPFGTFRVLKDVDAPETCDGVESISEANYQKLLATWNAIQDGSGKLHISKALTHWQYSELLQAFARLLSRPTGRFLVEFSVWEGADITISIGLGLAAPRGAPGEVAKRVNVNMPIYRDLENSLQLNDGSTFRNDPLFSTLGHELGHAFNLSYGANQGHLVEKTGYDNVEEFVAIQYWENAIRGEHELPLRKGHQGSYDGISTPLDKASHELLTSIYKGDADNEINTPRGQTLIRQLKIVSTNTNPELSDLLREHCREAANLLSVLGNFPEARANFIQQHRRDLETVYNKIPLLPSDGSSLASKFETFNHREFVRELNRLIEIGDQFSEGSTQITIAVARLRGGLDAIGIKSLDYYLAQLVPRTPGTSYPKPSHRNDRSARVS